MTAAESGTPIRVTVDGEPCSAEITLEQVRAYLLAKGWTQTEQFMARYEGRSPAAVLREVADKADEQLDLDARRSRRATGDAVNFARFVVRPGVAGGMIGINHGLFREGVVYEVTEVLDEFVIREIGDSPLGLPDVMARERFGFCNGWTWDHLYTRCGGGIVRTINELGRRQETLDK